MKTTTWSAHIIRLIWEISWGIWRKRCKYLHSTEEARKELLSNNIDTKISEIHQNMPPNTWMTTAQRKILNQKPEIISKWQTKQKIRWYKRAKIMHEAYLDHLDKTQNSQSALFMKNYITNTPQIAPRETQNQEPNNTINNPTVETPKPQLKQTTISDWIRGNVP